MGPDFCLAECYLKTDLITKKKGGIILRAHVETV